MSEQKNISYDSIDLLVLENYFNGTCSKEEEDQVNLWFEDPAYEKVLRYKLKEHWKKLDVPSSIELNSERLLDGIYHKMHFSTWEKSKQEPFYRKFYMAYSKIAAAVLLPLLLLGGWYLFGSKNIGEKVSLTEIYSPPAARTRFELPDGSSGWLNSGSSLTFPSRFTGSTRELSLKGEAYFDVHHDPRHPFVISTGQSQVHALGTSFNVMAWPDEEYSTLTMESGLTVVYRMDEKNHLTKLTELNRGEQLIYYNDGADSRKSKVNPDYFTSWKDGKLVFRNEPMGEVLKKLGRWYNVEFIVDNNEIDAYRYRATFRDETLDEVLKLLEHTSPIGHEELERITLSDGSFSKKRIRLFISP